MRKHIISIHVGYVRMLVTSFFNGIYRDVIWSECPRQLVSGRALPENDHFLM
jgi:hypothetical protein